MSKFVRNIVISEPFEGDTVVFTLRPMTFATALKFRALPDDDTTAVADFLATGMREHLISLTGLRDASGVEVSMEDLFLSAYFTTLVVAAGGRWVQESMPNAGN